MTIRLVEPDIKYIESFLSVKEELIAVREDKRESSQEIMGATSENFKEFVQKLEDNKAGINLPDGYVPGSTFWIINEDNKFIGRVSLRHRLTEQLKIYGGHIGYFVRPSERKKGYASEALSMTLLEARKLGLKKVLITCDEDNIGSKRTIEKNGGELQDKLKQDNSETILLRHWIDLETAPKTNIKPKPDSIGL